MINLNEKFKIMQLMAQIIQKYPYMRFCQIIGNVTSSTDPYYVTDKQLIENLERYLAEV